MRALVTGGAGFIGSHIVDLLLQEGHEVSVVDNLHSGKRENLDPRARFYRVDIAGSDVEHVIRGEQPEVVFHQAAQMSVKLSTDDPLYDAQVNVIGLLNVLTACVGAGVRKVVYASSGATYGNPTYLPMDEAHAQVPESPYGITKLMGEHYLSYFCRDHKLEYAALRYGNVYGPRQDGRGEAGVVAIFATQLLAGLTPVIHWDGEQTRDYVYVGDVARANLLAAMAPGSNCYCIGTGRGTSVNRIYEAVCDALGAGVAPSRGPRRAGDLRAAYFDTTRARRELGWVPTVSLEHGIDATVRWFQSQAAEAAAEDGRSGRRGEAADASVAVTQRAASAAEALMVEVA